VKGKGYRVNHILQNFRYTAFLYEGYEEKRKRKYRLYKGTECRKCEFSINCTKRKDGIRHLKIADFYKERKQLADKMKTEVAKKYTDKESR